MTEGKASQTSTVRVLVADDQQLMRDGIASLLSIQDGIEVVGTAANGQEAIEQALALQPDVVLMDVRMPVLDGVAATAQILRQLPECQVLMLTTFDDDEYVIEALRAGASGYLLKDIPAQHLAQAIQAVHRHIYQLDPSVARRVVASLAGQASADSRQPASFQATSNTAASTIKPGLLTEREIEVLRLIAQGATNREIAERLVISEGTVKNHISNILGRLGLRDRTQAAIYARERGWV
ncbi:MAG TPA: response regulator transcription factor [Ktedonobacterales bacterium]|jgi:DNA-binding NarL/FixJ family response regulator